MHVITINYIAKWMLKFNHNIWFTQCGKCYNNKSHKFLNQILKGSTIGYIIDKKFYSLKYLRNHLELIPKDILPF